jgi:hypothetical protein
MLRKALGAAKWLYTGIILLALALLLLVSATTGAQAESVVVVAGVLLLVPVGLWEAIKRLRG